MRFGPLLLVAAVVVLAATGTGAAADNTAPLAEAGVDQTVLVNSTVYLDATASTDPDGELTSVEWAIETPGGAAVTPECVDCRRTEFDATALGQYTVTLTVTDDDGATSSDTLYVTTTTERGPNVSIAGPTSTAPGSDATFTANVSTDEASLQTLTWLVNGSVVERQSLEGDSASIDFTHSFDSSAPVRVVVYDTLGNRGSATRRVSVGGGGGAGGSSVCRSSENDQLCNNDGADKRYTVDGQTYIADTNDQEGIQTYRDGRLITIENPTESAIISEGQGGRLIVDGTLSDVNTNNLETRQETVVLGTGDSDFGGDDSGDSRGFNELVDSTIDAVGSEIDGADADMIEANSGVDVNDDGSVSFTGVTIGGVEDSDDGDDESSDGGDDDGDGAGGGILGGGGIDGVL